VKIEYQLNENDFLIYQLYIASKSDRIKKKRQRNRIIIPILYLVLGIFLFWGNQILMPTLLVILGLLWFFFYPIWEKRRYVNHYKAFIQENYKLRLGRIVTLEFDNEYILAKDNGSESKVLATELVEMIELPTIILMKLGGGQSFILPKNEIPQLEELKANLRELAHYLKIKYEIEGEWEWK